MIAYGDFIARLKGFRRGDNDKGTALCPAHDDREHRSLSVKRKPDGGVLANCFVGCTYEQIVTAAGFSSNGDGRRLASTYAPLTLEAFASAKGLPTTFLRECGVSQKPWGLRIAYCERDGAPAGQQRRRTALAAKDGSLWEKGAGSPVPYGRWRLDDAMERSLRIVRHVGLRVR